jgi:hypothetical protein
MDAKGFLANMITSNLGTYRAATPTIIRIRFEDDNWCGRSNKGVVLPSFGLLLKVSRYDSTGSG